MWGLLLFPVLLLQSFWWPELTYNLKYSTNYLQASNCQDFWGWPKFPQKISENPMREPPNVTAYWNIASIAVLSMNFHHHPSPPTFQTFMLLNCPVFLPSLYKEIKSLTKIMVAQFNDLTKKERVTFWAKIAESSLQTRGTSAKSFDFWNVSTEYITFLYNTLSLAWEDFCGAHRREVRVQLR